VPELPEVESARYAITTAALGRAIVEVDDTDSYECRPHAPGEIRAALLGRSLRAAHRRGKTMWCDTSGTDAPVLGIHLGMSGRIVITDADGTIREGGDPRPRSTTGSHSRFDRFTLTFDDGGALALLDPRRLGRIRLDPDIDALGPDALTVTPAQFRAVMARGTAPVKARLLDQSAVAGVGNLLADETLWQARINPARAVADLSRADVDRLHRALRRALASAIERGGSHTGRMIEFRRAEARCPRCHAEMGRGMVGGRTTWWCSREQAV
jgi:formamidopyrimidine-DNA glycosylase